MFLAVTHPSWEIEFAFALRASGLGARRIGRSLGIPTSTVTDWVSGRVPSNILARPGRCGVCGHEPHAFDELDPAYVYLLGLYLGDGCIATHPRAYKLRIILDSAYPKMIEEAADAIRQVLPRSEVSRCQRPGCEEVYSYSRSWPCLFPQHGPGKKHLRRIVLTDWQKRLVERTPELLLRGLIHSDGCRFMNTGRGGWRCPRYSFTNYSPDIRRIFTDACDLLDLRWTTASGTTVYVSRKADVDKMDRFIGPKA
ncbi:MAG TPA: hypothetical protein VG602_01140 [Actinomycetota bacterium]|nr:hypothetical protein [Actinomycetota bacterium]